MFEAIGFLQDDNYFLAFLATLFFLWILQGLAFRRLSWRLPPTDSLILSTILAAVLVKYVIPLLVQVYVF